ADSSLGNTSDGSIALEAAATDVIGGEAIGVGMAVTAAGNTVHNAGVVAVTAEGASAVAVGLVALDSGSEGLPIGLPTVLQTASAGEGATLVNNGQVSVTATGVGGLALGMAGLGNGTNL